MCECRCAIESVGKGGCSRLIGAPRRWAASDMSNTASFHRLGTHQLVGKHVLVPQLERYDAPATNNPGKKNSALRGLTPTSSSANTFWSHSSNVMTRPPRSSAAASNTTCGRRAVMHMVRQVQYVCCIRCFVLYLLMQRSPAGRAGGGQAVGNCVPAASTAWNVCGKQRSAAGAYSGALQCTLLAQASTLRWRNRRQ